MSGTYVDISNSEGGRGPDPEEVEHPLVLFLVHGHGHKHDLPLVIPERWHFRVFFVVHRGEGIFYIFFGLAVQIKNNDMTKNGRKSRTL